MDFPSHLSLTVTFSIEWLGNEVIFFIIRSYPVIFLFYSSTWLKTQSPSWKASMRDHSNSHLLISLMWALTRTTPGLSNLLHHILFLYSTPTFCDSLYHFAFFLSVLRRGNLPGRTAFSGAFVVPAPRFLPTMQHCSVV